MKCKNCPYFNTANNTCCNTGCIEDTISEQKRTDREAEYWKLLNAEADAEDEYWRNRK